MKNKIWQRAAAARNLDSFVFWSICILTATAALIFDLSQPLGVAGGVPYISLVLLGIFDNRYRVVIVLTLAATLLTLLGYELSGPLAPLHIVMVNRALALFAIWTVACAVALVIMQRKALQLQARLDPLTNAYNRTHLNSVLNREVSIWRREGRPLSLIMMDLDHFKSINDAHGHQIGDRVLQEIVRVSTAHIRATDWLCRFGGEEFVAILPDASLESAGLVAERIRRAVGQIRIRSLDQQEVAVSISLGVATMRYEYGDPDSLLAAADKALYRSKRRGRNQVSLCKTGLASQLHQSLAPEKELAEA